MLFEVYYEDAGITDPRGPQIGMEWVRLEGGKWVREMFPPCLVCQLWDGEWVATRSCQTARARERAWSLNAASCILGREEGECPGGVT